MLDVSLISFPDQIVVPFLGKGIYNVYFHPLRHIPGPKWTVFSEIPYTKTILQGNAVWEINRLHKKYGPVVRVAPNQVAFLTTDSWKAIYGFRQGLKDGYEKDMHFFPPPLSGERGLVMALAKDHGRQRRVFSHAFAENSLRQQEPILRKYSDLLMQRLHQQVDSPTKGVVDIVSWFNFATFDAIADLTYGEPYGCLEKSTYDPIVALTFAAFYAMAFNDAQLRIPWLKHFMGYFVPREVISQRESLMNFNIRKVERRLAMETQRDDFMTSAADALQKNVLSLAEIQSCAQIFIVAGSETTATTLSATVYLTLSHPEVYKRVTEEVRSSFPHVEEINITTINSRLQYMLAVLNETLRIYPPVPTGFGRIVPKGGDVISGFFIPEGTSVYVSQYASNHCQEYFYKPDEFLPERWLGGEQFKNDNHNVFQPFSTGPRNCIGKNLAILEMRMILATLLWNFDLELLRDDGGAWLSEQKVFSLWSKGPLQIRLKPVKRD
ncbi:hypothetical protein AYL99_00176 [Fonsecaea erecta]|uniref:Cytochrome P450 monooxygenase n=1 Tax=Fonsecaea erecta TaxID=1367422 RepID=A0A178ZWP7_9EURO|nr:hypothetical protein AYL99_00176 [Fonsecaea erecta]OAP64204.1 hypothetical protein AYL99_00176 [Fonsecaea erecta]